MNESKLFWSAKKETAFGVPENVSNESVHVFICREVGEAEAAALEQPGLCTRRWWEWDVVRSLRNIVWQFLNVLNIHRFYELAIPGLGVYPKGNTGPKKTAVRMSAAAPFRVA